ncbi:MULTISPECIES: phage terminase large subunit [unclassified Breznakia]|nr:MULTISPECIES: phage terminase large subunit [unclassified Breznakia]
MIRQGAKIELAKREFFSFCNLLAPDFYKEDREYLVNLCNTLQALYEGRIIRITPEKKWKVVDELPTDSNYEVCKKFMMNMPPQHGKSRTLINFCCWVFGVNSSEKIITASYNDVTASDFSRYTRDEIAQTKNDITDVVYSDVFPLTKIKRGNGSFEKWALEGEHFSYLGAGTGGSITSKGGTILIVDDPIKGAEEAFNNTHLEKVWKWYANTFRSRVSAVGGEPIEIVNMTRWADDDVCGKLLTSSEADEWYVMKLEAYDKETDTMLCSEIFNKKRYLSQRALLDSTIFMANYHQQPINVEGRLYSSFKTYEHIPVDSTSRPLFTSIRSYTDTADEGDDYLCSLIWGVYEHYSYVLDVIYTQQPMEETEPMVAAALDENKAMLARIESNNGGKGYARQVASILEDDLHNYTCDVTWFHQSSNKVSRILTAAPYIMRNVLFPVDWKYRWPEYYDAMVKYQRKGKNKHDDAPDATSGIKETNELLD